MMTSESGFKKIPPESSGPPSESGAEEVSFHDASASPDDTIVSVNPPMAVYTDSTEDITVSQNTSIFLSGGMLPAGTVFGHYVITKYIGGGGMGRVYLGVDRTLDRKVAIKVLPYQRATDRSAVARFMNEAKSAARLNHEHIAQVYFAGEHDGIPFIAFEYVEGTNIRTLVEETGPLPLPQAVNFLLQITEALAHAATHHVIHRDVKPSNILITQNAQAKLIDMGLARLLSPTTAEADLTASGVTLGTFDYISPEQARDPRNADTRSDIYSLGCTFFFMLTARPPFSEGTVLQKLLQHQGDIPPDVREFQPKIPEKVALLIQKMMAKDPKSRFQSPLELVRELVEIAEMAGLHPKESGHVLWPGSRYAQKSLFIQTLPWLVPTVIFLGIVLFTHFYWMSQTEISPPPFPPVTVKPADTQELSTQKTGGTQVNPPLAAAEPVGMIPEDLLIYADSEHNGILSWTGLVGGGVSPSLQASLNFDTILAGEDFGMTENMIQTVLETGVLAENQILPPAEPSGMPRRVLFDPFGQTEGAVNSFEAVLKAAEKEAVIEFCFSGDYTMPPLHFSSVNYRFIAAEGKYPRLNFRPSDSRNVSMMTLSESSLAFEKVALELVVPETPASHWSMFNLVDTNSLAFDHSVLTIRNVTVDQTTYHENTAFFRCSSRPIGIAVPETGGTQAALQISSGVSVIKSATSVIHGEAAILKCDVSRPIDVELTNTFAAVSQPVLVLMDTKEDKNRIRLTLRHVTMLVPSMIFWQRGYLTGYAGQPVQLTLEDSLVQLLRPGTLSEYAGDGIITETSAIFQQNQTRSFLTNATDLLTLRPSAKESGGVPAAAQGIRHTPDANVSWQNNLFESKPIHRIVPSDMLLNEYDRSNPALQSDNGRNAGITSSDFDFFQTSGSY
ncbi:MAG: serine/threonine protein kinase [Planctomycetaceae bacterium]|jgi:serine/threonine protein kinase|nr:serine/threonine protein kinase [Planctomycetaceae bacterium]